MRCTALWSGVTKHGTPDSTTEVTPPPAARDEMESAGTVYDERPSHPQYTTGILKVPKIGRKMGMSYDAVGCASRRRTSPEPLVPEINRVNQGYDSWVGWIAEDKKSGYRNPGGEEK